MKPILRSGIILCFLFFLGRSCGLAIEHAKPCFSLEPAQVSLEGNIREEEFTDTDQPSNQPEVCWILHLPKPVCVGKGDDEFLDDDVVIEEIQLALEPKQYDAYQNLLNSFVKLSGNLFAAHTAHHHTKILLSVKRLEKINK
jgi:hypothetical protein